MQSWNRTEGAFHFGVFLVVALSSVLSVRDLHAVDFIRGDANGNGIVSLADSFFILFGSNPGRNCLDAYDVDDDGQVNPLLDAIALVRFLYLDGDAPKPPFPALGPDPTADDVLCDFYDGKSVPFEDPEAELRVEALGAQGTATITIHITASTTIGSYSGRILDEAGVIRSLPSLGARNLSETVPWHMSARLDDAQIHFGYQVFLAPGIAPGEDRAVLTIPVRLVRDTPVGEYPLRFQFGEMVKFESALLIEPRLVDGVLTVTDEIIDDDPSDVSHFTGSRAIEWERHFGSVEGGARTPQAVHETTGGGYIIVGENSSSPSLSGRDVYLAKIDAEGNLLWERTFGGDGRQSGHAIQETADGGFIILGVSSSGDPGDPTDVYLAKTDSQGNPLWEKTIGHEDEEVYDWGFSVAVALDGGYAIVGFQGATAFLLKTDSEGNQLWKKQVGESLQWVQSTPEGGYLVAGSKSVDGRRHVYLAKTDGAGEILWERTFGGENDQGAQSVQATTDGGYIVVGLSGSVDSLGFGTAFDVVLLKTDSTGNLLWERTFGREGEEEWDRGLSVAEIADGGYVVVGFTGTACSIYCGQSDVYLLQTDLAGNLVSERSFGGESREWGMSAAASEDGGVLVAAVIGFDIPTNPPLGDILLMKLDASGNTVWERTFNGEKGVLPTASSVTETADGGYMVAGTAGSFDRDSTTDVYLAKTDSSGTLLWAKTFGGEGDDFGQSVQETWDGGYIVAGTRVGGSSRDIYLVKTDFDGNLLWEKSFRSGTNDDEGFSIVQTADDGFVVAGASHCGLRSDLGRNPPCQTLLLLKTDSDGGFLWRLELDDKEASSVIETSDGDLVVVGRATDRACLPDGCVDLYLLKADAQGNVLWEEYYGGEGTEGGNCVIETTEGGYLIAGSISEVSERSDVYLLRTDEDGAFLWDRSFGLTGEEWANSVAETASGGFLVAGTRESVPMFTKRNVYVLETDSDGKLIWEGSFGGEGQYGEGRAVLTTSEDECVVAGFTDPVHEVYLMKLGSPASFKRGDSDGDGLLTVGDAIANLGFQFLGTVHPTCLDALDFDDSGTLDVSDAVGNLSFQFLGGVPPAPPGNEDCGVDPTVDESGDLGCERYPQDSC